ncbi:allantoate amidohydrolase [Kineococcus glutinatus]|uniref:Allantoate amidohydrolase n=1 Tax=Kineococcus glutinatus TaxID=1070872 RepID=A0ABP8VDB5_9ACTN
MSAAGTDVRTATARVLARCDELAALSASPDGIERVYLSPEHAAANALAAGWMAAAGLRTRQDAAGNLCGRLEGREPGLPALLLASHLDTVPDAGRYDGILGVVLAVEVAARLRGRAAELPFALEVVAFADEEGTRFGTALLGSRALAGTWDEAWWSLTDARGTTLAEAFAAFGLDPARVGEAARDPRDVVGYLEAHIEQGPLLEDADRALGVVTSIAGARRFSCTVTGEARHAGGTPYERRRDALCAASEVVLLVERTARESGVIATVGRSQAFPGAVNVVPGRVELSLDLRAEHDGDRDGAWERIRAQAERLCAARGCGFAAEEHHSAPGVVCAPRLQEAVRRGIAATGDAEPPALYSRAGHDAMAVASLTDVGMLFVRCAGGISHAPEESVEPADVALALDALTAAVLDLAGGDLVGGDLVGGSAEVPAGIPAR